MIFFFEECVVSFFLKFWRTSEGFLSFAFAFLLIGSD